MQSASKNPLVVCDYLRSETEAGTLIGLLERMVVPSLQINCFGVVPKLQQPGKWRLIVGLSRPRKHSVNDGVLKEYCSLKYPSVDDAVPMVHALMAHLIGNLPYNGEGVVTYCAGSCYLGQRVERPIHSLPV